MFSEYGLSQRHPGEGLTCHRVTNLARQASSWSDILAVYLCLWMLIELQGHEFTGIVEETGSQVKNFQKGDQVVSPFTVSW